jgi:hypothetical protein
LAVRAGAEAAGRDLAADAAQAALADRLQPVDPAPRARFLQPVQPLRPRDPEVRAVRLSLARRPLDAAGAAACSAAGAPRSRLRT